MSPARCQTALPRVAVTLSVYLPRCRRSASGLRASRRFWPAAGSVLAAARRAVALVTRCSVRLAGSGLTMSTPILRLGREPRYILV